jgi:chromosome segregation ATPase
MSAPVSVSSARPSGELTVLQRLEAFRDLIRHGNALLGEVVSYCREAEAAVNQLAADKQDVDQMRAELQDARSRAEAEAAAARHAMGQVEAQRHELGGMRQELIQARAAMEQFQRNQSHSAETLERSLRDAKQQQVELEHELQRVRAQAASARTLDQRLAQIDHMETKLHVTERELAETRRALETERSRRDRAIALIKPKQAAEG